MKHITVLQTEAVEALGLKKDSVVVDATHGSGGHTGEILSKLGSAGTYIGIDADASAFSHIKQGKKGKAPHTHFIVNNFRNIDSILHELHIGAVDAILADLGWRTEQFTEGKKGFSFHDTSRLSMTYGDPADYPFTAHDIVNDWDEEHIADVIFGYGEERAGRRIAKAIVDARNETPIETAKELADVVANAIPTKFHSKRLHPATKTFQALRIAVNDERGALEDLVRKGIPLLKTRGRMAIITFHSIEDRLVKQLFNAYAHDQIITKVTKKPITPTREEVTHNPRARSAKLRIVEKL